MTNGLVQLIAAYETINQGSGEVFTSQATGFIELYC
jgi:hypothetical protein